MKSALLLLAIAIGFGVWAMQTPSQPKARLDQFLAALNTKDADKVRSMIESNFAPSMFGDRKLEEWVSQIGQIASQLAPLSIEKTIEEKPSSIVVEAKDKQGNKWGLRLDCKPNSPYRMVGILLDRDPQNLIDKKKTDYSNYTSIQDLAHKIREDRKVPAMAVATWRDGKIEVGVDGLRKLGEKEAVTNNDRWIVGSIGKSMTCTLVASLIEEGKLRWDSKLGDLLKDIPMKDAYKAVTLEQLMQHRSGVPQDQTFTPADVRRIVGSLKDPIAIRAAYTKDILNRDPIGKPGEKMAYSNAGYAILGHIAERVGKKPFPQLMQERVFKPIGMSSALCGMPGETGMPSSKGQPHGHINGPNGPIPYKLDGPIIHLAVPAGGGIACSIGDLAKYTAWHMRGFLGEKVPGLSAKTIQRLHTPPTPQGYAAGWQVTKRLTPTEMHTHNGSDGTFLAEMAFFPKEKLVVVGITNIGAEAPSPGMEAVLAVYAKAK